MCFVSHYCVSVSNVFCESLLCLCLECVLWVITVSLFGMCFVIHYCVSVWNVFCESLLCLCLEFVLLVITVSLFGMCFVSLYCVSVWNMFCESLLCLCLEYVLWAIIVSLFHCIQLWHLSKRPHYTNCEKSVLIFIEILLDSWVCFLMTLTQQFLPPPFPLPK